MPIYDPSKTLPSPHSQKHHSTFHNDKWSENEIISDARSPICPSRRARGIMAALMGRCSLTEKSEWDFGKPSVSALSENKEIVLQFLSCKMRPAITLGMIKILLHQTSYIYQTLHLLYRNHQRRILEEKTITSKKKSQQTASESERRPCHQARQSIQKIHSICHHATGTAATVTMAQ